MSARIAPGGQIAVVAPCGAFDPARLAQGLTVARAHGLDVVELPDLLRPHRYLASPDEQRAAQLMEALSSDRWAAVWIVRGGYGLTRILDRIDPAKVRPKPIIGFSDVTALFAALHPHGKGPLVHGPMPHSLPSTDEASTEALFALLAGEPPAPMSGETWAPGEASGPLVGGNLCLLAALCGTPWQLDVAGTVLVLEEVGEPPYRIDRLLQQLVSAGGLRGVAAVAVGEMTNPAPEGADWTLRDVVMDHLGPLGVPVVAGLPIGHGARNRPFVWGTRAHVGDGELRFSPVVG
ncbi:MAG: LD-carboxypeptidase [Myxococcota bacterium]